MVLIESSRLPFATAAMRANLMSVAIIKVAEVLFWLSGTQAARLPLLPLS